MTTSAPAQPGRDVPPREAAAAISEPPEPPSNPEARHGSAEACPSAGGLGGPSRPPIYI